LIGIIRCHVNSIQSIETHAPLEAGACLMGDETEHLNFFYEIIDTLVDMGESVNLPTG
jgi:hypothetical protein